MMYQYLSYRILSLKNSNYCLMIINSIFEEMDNFINI